MKRPLIGVFDSGVGGLTVLRELLTQVPGADYLYFGDTARLPYGSKSVETIGKYGVSAAHFLRERGISMLVVACNTASALAFDRMASAMNVPMLGVIEPGADAAAKSSRSRNATVIATEGTVSSHAYRRALEARRVSAHEVACPLFVPLVEEGWLDHAVTEQVAHIYLDGQFTNGADTLVLGCTHYPLLKPLLRRVVPPHIAIIDSAESTAARVSEKFTSSSAAGAGSVHFFATDSVEKFRRAGEKFLGRAITGVEHVDLES